MGDRCVVGFKARHGEQALYLYSHWGGADRHHKTAIALEAARPRWDDPSYATRIAISSIIGDDWDKETGYGLSIGHGSYPAPDYDELAMIVWEERTIQLWDSQQLEVRFEMRFIDYMEAVKVDRELDGFIVF